MSIEDACKTYKWCCEEDCQKISQIHEKTCPNYVEKKIYKWKCPCTGSYFCSLSCLERHRTRDKCEDCKNSNCCTFCLGHDFPMFNKYSVFKCSINFCNRRRCERQYFSRSKYSDYKLCCFHQKQMLMNIDRENCSCNLFDKRKKYNKNEREKCKGTSVCAICRKLVCHEHVFSQFKCSHCICKCEKEFIQTIKSTQPIWTFEKNGTIYKRKIRNKTVMKIISKMVCPECVEKIKILEAYMCKDVAKICLEY